MKALIIDIDGVVMLDDQAAPGASELVSWLKSNGRPFLFLTNFPSQTPADLSGRLAAVGLDVPPQHFYNSAMATADFLTSQAGDRRLVFVVGEGALVHELYQAGFTLSESDADFVVLGETRAYNFEMIQRASQLVKKGARFIATNPDVAGPQGRPSCGAFAAPIERITGKAPFYVGKPSAFMMRSALRHLQAHEVIRRLRGSASGETRCRAIRRDHDPTVLLRLGVRHDRHRDESAGTPVCGH